MSKRDLTYVIVEDFLRSLQTRNVSRSGDEINFSCPSANHIHGDNSPSARMNARTTLWVCHGGACGLRGDAVTFLTAFHGLNDSEAVRVLEERYGGHEQSVEAGGLAAEVERIMGGPMVEELRRVPPDEEWIARFHVNWLSDSLPIWKTDGGTPFGYMLDRGFSRETLLEWEIGWDDLSERITIPVHDADGVLVGFKGRAWHAAHHPRYLIIGDAPSRTPRYGFDTYQKSHVVFALDRARGERAVIVEGELNAIALHDAGELGAVSVAGSEFSQTQATLIVRRFSSAVIYFDADEPGRNGTRLLLEGLSPYIPCSIVLDAPNDAAALGPDALLVVAAAVPALQVAF